MFENITPVITVILHEVRKFTLSLINKILIDNLQLVMFGLHHISDENIDTQKKFKTRTGGEKRNIFFQYGESNPDPPDENRIS